MDPNIEVLISHIDTKLEEQTKTIFNRLNKLEVKMDDMTQKMAKHEACYQDVNGNGQPGLKKTVEDQGRTLERHETILKIVCLVAGGAVGSSGTSLAQQIFHFI